MEFSDSNQMRQLDTFVVGSDQVWNTDITGPDKTYLLDFIKNDAQKVSYAASCGSIDKIDQPSQLICALKEFHAISVRERSLRNMLKSLCPELKADTCIDPVFLKSKEEWRKYSMQTPLCLQEYILVFIMGVSKQADYIIEHARILSKKTGYKVMLLGDQERWYKYWSVEHIGIATPFEFINYIDNARCVLTNSFHATAFSIILNTNFFVEMNISVNERLKDILEITNLESRGMWNGTTKSEWNEDIRWNDINSIIEKEVLLSKNYIENHIING